MEEDILEKRYKRAIKLLNETSLPLFVEDTFEDIFLAYKKLQKENEQLIADNLEYQRIQDIFDKRTYRKKYLEERRKEEPDLLFPDSDEIYKRYYELKAIALNSEKTVHTCLHCGNDTPLYCENCYQELISKNAELQLENEDSIVALKSAIMRKQIDDSIPKQVIRDKIELLKKELNLLDIRDKLTLIENDYIISVLKELLGE